MKWTVWAETNKIWRTISGGKGRFSDRELYVFSAKAELTNVLREFQLTTIHNNRDARAAFHFFENLGTSSDSYSLFFLRQKFMGLKHFEPRSHQRQLSYGQAACCSASPISVDLTVLTCAWPRCGWPLCELVVGPLLQQLFILFSYFSIQSVRSPDNHFARRGLRFVSSACRTSQKCRNTFPTFATAPPIYRSIYASGRRTLRNRKTVCNNDAKLTCQFCCWM
jgi:hypothetical protein